VTCSLIHHINFNVMFNVNEGEKMLNNKVTRALFIFISYLRLVILLLRAGCHGKIVIEKRRRDSEMFGKV
jgi:hypothetical protein